MADNAAPVNRFARSASIAVRLALAFAMLLALLAGVVALALKQLDRVGESGRIVAESSLRQVLLARQAEKAAQAGAQQLHTLFLLDTRQDRVPVYAMIDTEFGEQKIALSQLLADAHAVEDAVVVERLIATRGRFEAAFQHTVNEVELDMNAARPIMVKETLPALNDMLDALDALVAVKSAQANATIASIKVQQAQSRRDVLELSGLAVLVALLCAVMITRSITRPLAQTVALAREIADGKLDSPMPQAGRDEVGGLIKAIGEMRDSLAQREARIVDLAFRDPLTGLANRTLFNDRLDQAVGTATRTGHAMSVLLIDLDRFKEVNDVLGHPVGDELLNQVSGRLTRELRRTTDTVARIGGDEFAVLLPAQGREGAVLLARQLLAALDMPVTIEGQTVDVSGSIGIATFPEDGATTTELMAHADSAMYVAKQASSGYAAFDQRMARTGEHGLSLLSDLRRAVDENQFYLQFQPKVSLADRSCLSAEVLIRWRHPTRGFVPPDQFIPFAERTGAIKSITRWVLARGLAQLAQWRAQGLEMSLNINVSTRDLVGQDLPALVKAQLLAEGVAARHLCLEVTESAIMEDPAHALASLQALHDMGVRLSIDDFGTGYSSLAYLKKLPVQELKIDRSFVMNLDRDDDDINIVRSTIDMAHHMGLQVTAEGVETESVAGKLRSLGCDDAQGYLFSRPLNAEDFVAWAVVAQAQRPRAAASATPVTG
ncbi:MAG: putative bifunctional diguanylate cyclase/phosphodiesterase [Burkholderiaceae bacterium]